MQEGGDCNSHGEGARGGQVTVVTTVATVAAAAASAAQLVSHLDKWQQAINGWGPPCVIIGITVFVGVYLSYSVVAEARQGGRQGLMYAGR